MLLNKRKQEKIFLSLDIGTESVKTVIFQKKIKNEARVDLSSPDRSDIVVLSASLQYLEKYSIFNHSTGSAATLNDSQRVDGKDFGTEVVKRAILKAIEEARKKLLLSLTEKELKDRVQKQKKWQVLLGISADKLKGRIVSQFFIKENFEEKILGKEEKDICQEVLERTKKEVSQNFAKEFGILPSDIHWISLKILEMKIDGYPVPRLYGYKGRNLEFKILITFLPKYYLENIKKMLGSLDMEILGIVHLAAVLPILCRDERKDGIFIDVGGDITQIFLIKNGNLGHVREFEGGGRAFSEALSQRLRIDEETARALKERYSNRVLSIGTTKKIKEIFVKEQNNWYLNLEKQIKKINQKEFFLSNIYLFGGGSLLPEIKEILEKKVSVYLEDSFTADSTKIEFIYPENLKNINNLAMGLKNSQSTPSLLICYQAPRD